MCKRILFVQEHFFIKNFISKRMIIAAFVVLTGVSLSVYSMEKNTDTSGLLLNLDSENKPVVSLEIFDAIKKDDLETVKNIVLGVKSGVKFNFDTLNADGENVLCFACAENKTDIAEFLIKNGARRLINIYNDENCWTPLSWAAYWGNLDLVEFLLKYGSEPVVNLFDKKYNATPIYWPIVKQDTKMVELLIKNGAKIEDNCFYEVCYGKDGEAFKKYYTPIELASALRKIQIKRFLIGENFAGILKLYAKKIGLGSLGELKKTVRLAKMEDFINKKFSTDGFKGITLLYCAFFHNKYHEMAFLLKKGADINLEYDLYEDFRDLFRKIDAKEVALKKEDFKTGSLLTLAAAGNNIYMVKFLIDNGATVEQKDIDIATFDEIKADLIEKRKDQEEKKSKTSLCSKVKQEELPSVLGKRSTEGVLKINLNNSGVNSVTSVSDVSEFARKRKIE